MILNETHTCAFRMVRVVSSAGMGNFQASSIEGILQNTVQLTSETEITRGSNYRIYLCTSRTRV